jgi:hypothetical protein
MQGLMMVSAPPVYARRKRIIIEGVSETGPQKCKQLEYSYIIIADGRIIP